MIGDEDEDEDEALKINFAWNLIYVHDDDFLPKQSTGTTRDGDGGGGRAGAGAERSFRHFLDAKVWRQCDAACHTDTHEVKKAT